MSKVKNGGKQILIRDLAPIHRVIAYILKKLDKDLGSVELVKIVYLIDVLYFRLFGKTITGLKYIRWELGPYTREILNAAADLEERGRIIETQLTPSRGISSIFKRSHKLKKEVKFEPSLLPEEIEVINCMLNKIKDFTPKKLEEESYKTEPMQKILEKEKKVKERLNGAPLDFSLIKRDEFMERWITNQKKEEEDLEYTQYLEKEKKELDELIAQYER